MKDFDCLQSSDGDVQIVFDDKNDMRVIVNGVQTGVMIENLRSFMVTSDNEVEIVYDDSADRHVINIDGLVSGTTEYSKFFSFAYLSVKFFETEQ